MKTLFLFFSLLFINAFASAQQYDQLISLNNTIVNTWYSKGFEPRAKQTAARLEKVISFYEELLEFKPAVTLLMLSKADWSLYTTFPVYGMPHYNNDSVLIVAAEDNEFWRSFLDTKGLPHDLAMKVESVYRASDSTISMQPFFDLLAIHELGHAFHIQGKLQVQRKWMGELFCNILLHTYIAEKEPSQLPALTVFPQMVVNGGTKDYKFTSLQQLEDNYDELGQYHPKNYGWYQCRWHAAAAKVYDADGKSIVNKLWVVLSTNQQKLNDEELAILLRNRVSKTMAQVLTMWDDDMIR